MNSWHLLLREIIFRSWNFFLGMLAVVVAVASLIGVLTVLQLHDMATAEIINRKEEETKDRVAKLNDDYRKITKNLGFNILILPKAQDLWSLKTMGYATEYMPEENVKKLASSKIVSINHLLPMVQEMVQWKEQGDRRVLLTGTRGEVPLMHANPKKPLVYPVPKGSVAVGYQLAESLQLKPNAEIAFLGKNYKIAKVHPKRGNLDDITVWMSLEEAQEILDRKGRVNLIMALECNCNAPDRLGQIRKEVSEILPDTQVEELESIATARAKARNRAAAEGKAAIEAEKANRAEMREQYNAFAALLIPIVLLGSVVWLGFTTLNNVRERQGEIGILRALGLSLSQVYFLFVGKALIIGFVGALLGYGLGTLAGTTWSDIEMSETAVLFDPTIFLLVVIAAPLISGLVGWMAATVAVRQDPAVVLQNA